MPSLPAAQPLRLLFLCLVLSIAACTTVPRGVLRAPSSALQQPQDTALGRKFLEEAGHHDGMSGFHLINAGIDGFVTRMLMARNAERTLDLQYFIFHGDKTGMLLADELRRAADRGVRVRILVDDGATAAGDDQILRLDGHANIQVRVFNPFDYRGHNVVLRSADFLLHKNRLDYRMHNKLMVADNAVALIGGRNVGNQYFQIDPDSQFADDDVFAAGPVVAGLSAVFDDFWNSDRAVPAGALGHPAPSQSPRSRVSFAEGGIDYAARMAAGEPYAGLVSGRIALDWARSQIVADTPDKKSALAAHDRANLMAPEVLAAMREATSELLMITPYFVPSENELAILQELRARGARVGILCNSLESVPELSAHSGYAKFRMPLLTSGVEMYEVRALLDGVRGSGQTREVSSYGNYALHAKLYVFDRRRVYIGSMNYDQRSLRINTEAGLIIDSPELAAEVVQRFSAMTSPQESYALGLSAGADGEPSIVWRTQFRGREVELTREPSRSFWRREGVKMLSLVSLDPEL